MSKLTKEEAIKKANNDQLNLVMLKAKLRTEITALEQEYKRCQTSINELKERQGDISSEIQKKLDKIQTEAEKLDEFMFEHKIGEFSYE